MKETRLLASNIVFTLTLWISVPFTLHYAQAENSEFTSDREFTADVGYYYYEETANNAFFMSDQSDPAFFSIGIRDWSVPTHKEFGVSYTTEVTYGRTEYVGSGIMTKDYYKARFESYLGYSAHAQITPFIGLGYRWLYDNSGGVFSSTGAGGYDRQSQYLYAPIGGTFDLTGKFSVKAAYNLFLAGRQTSYFSTFSSAFSDVENEQDSGWGVDVSATYKLSDRWGAYAYYRHWDIDDSETSGLILAGIATFSVFEPANTTDESGIGVSYKF